MTKELKQFIENTGPQAISWEKWIEKAKKIMTKQADWINFYAECANPDIGAEVPAKICQQAVFEVIKTECEGV